HLIKAKDCMDWDFYGDGAEMCYEISSSAGNVNYCSFCLNCWDGNSNLFYCDLSTGSKNCFGCIGLRSSSYCILNKQYTQEEYEKLLPEIIKHMESTGEWGEFFPSTLSPFGYNETLAQDYLPLTQEEVAARGLKWKNKNEKVGYQGPKVELPDSILEADEKMICSQILTCEVSEANFKIIPQEFNFYKKFSIPLPRRKPYQRYLDRMAMRNPRCEFVRPCAKCGHEMKTSYASERPEIVYCEGCYLGDVYGARSKTQRAEKKKKKKWRLTKRHFWAIVSPFNHIYASRKRYKFSFWVGPETNDRFLYGKCGYTISQSFRRFACRERQRTTSSIGSRSGTILRSRYCSKNTFSFPGGIPW
ncbi:MAG: hypothetical protein WCT46_06185, partial [Candidatus Gracilibacteria bacterium]